ncbi:histone H1-like [Drosophila obscura]|uniref:histone H1-like n=1 Tax=Drosophila obscura TaxID=7282 RepID=UPI000BA0E02C|nr:histone H1-like [Drosophila obscura]
MKKLQVKAPSNSRKEIGSKIFAQMESASASASESEFESNGEESEKDEGEEEEDVSDAPKSTNDDIGFDRVGHPEASSPYPFPTPPPDAGTRMAARKTSVISEILMAIEALDNKAGSSVKAIVKYMKSNGHEVTDESRFGRQVLRSLKLCITKGQVEQIKRSFKLTKAPKNRRKSVENLRAHQALEKAKEKAKEKERKAQAKKEAKEAKDSAKAMEKAAKQPSKKKKAAAEVSIEMVSSPSAPTAKNNSKSKSKTRAKQNKPRKSIGTLAKPMVKSKVNVKAVKQLVAGKGKDLSELGDDLDAGANMLEAQATSTPQLVAKATRKR